MGRAEVFGLHNPVLPSIGDGLGTAVGYGLALLLIAIPRQLLGAGGIVYSGKLILAIPYFSEHPIAAFMLPPGSFLITGLLHGLFRKVGVEKHE